MDFNKEDLEKSGIYIIKNSINNKVYIGSSLKFKKRFKEHRINLKSNNHNPKLQNFVNKYGIEVLIFDILELVDRASLLEREQFYINLFDSFNNGFNCNPLAQSPLGSKRSLEQIEKMKLRVKGKNNGMYGKNHTEETKNKIAEKHKGKKLSPESLIKFNRRGKKNNEKQLNFIKNLNKGKNLSLETRLKISKSRLGKTILANCKTILQIDENYNIIKEWISITEASKKLFISRKGINDCCLNKKSRKTAGGFKWKYKN